MKPIMMILVLTICITRCQTTLSKRLASYQVIRENFFDTAGFNLPASDTNRYDLTMLEKVFERIQLDAASKALLVESVVEHVPVRNYKLMDLNTGQYYSASQQDKGFSFVVTNDSATKLELDSLRKRIDALSAMIKVDSTDRGKNHLGYRIVSVIEEDKPVIRIRSFYISH